MGTFYKFFAGAGMARAGLGDRWRCLFANDFDQKKAATYRLNWGMDNVVCSDVREVKTTDLQQTADRREAQPRSSATSSSRALFADRRSLSRGEELPGNRCGDPGALPTFGEIPPATTGNRHGRR